MQKTVRIAIPRLPPVLSYCLLYILGKENIASETKCALPPVKPGEPDTGELQLGPPLPLRFVFLSVLRVMPGTAFRV